MLGHRIAKGITSDGKLWLLGMEARSKGGAGGLISIGLVDSSRSVYFARGVIDIQKSSHELWVLRQGAKHGEYVVSVWSRNAFSDLSSFRVPDQDEPIVLLNIGGSPAVLSRRALRISIPDHSNWRTIQLDHELRSGVQINAASPRSGKRVYIGINLGEWGGGLQAVNVESGKVSSVERRDTNELCEGPLNSDCDPVTGVISDPQNDACVIASVGLIHLFMSEGRLLRVCGDTVTPIFEREFTGGIGGKAKLTEAFFGLAAAGAEGFWGLTESALYHFAVDGTQQREYKLPRLSPVSGIYLSRELPSVIIVRTDVNWAVSTSGYTPLLVPLEEH